MAFAAANATESRAFSIGPVKIQVLTYSVASGDTTGTVTADALTTIDNIIVMGVAGVATAAPTYAANVATLAFVDPAATRYGQVICIGR
jgi:hypothetical protein